MANLIRYDVKACPPQQRSVPLVVPHLLQPVMGSNTKGGAAPAQSDNTLKKHKYKIKGLEKVMTVLTSPSAVRRPRWL